MNIIRAARTGWTDGLEQPYGLSVGMTYDSDARQAAYDHASIWAQRIARIVDVWPSARGSL